MNKIREASREVTIGLLQALDEQHKKAVEAGNKPLSEAILAQCEALYMSAAKETEAVKEDEQQLVVAHRYWFLLWVKGARNRMRRRMK